jgi:hypothetical protein
MRNPCLEAALRELSDAGIRDVERAQGGKHLQLRWRVNGGEQRVYSLAATPSDVRAAANTRTDIRRMLREDGLLREQTKVTATVPKPSHRIAALEGRVANLERELKTLFAKLANIGGRP